MARESWGMRARRQVAHATIYSLLVAVTAIMLFPVAWMFTVSVRPNVEVKTQLVDMVTLAKPQQPGRPPAQAAEHGKTAVPPTTSKK